MRRIAHSVWFRVAWSIGCTLLLALHGRGHPIVLPETPKRGNPLIFRLWQPGDELVPERFGTFRPLSEDELKSPAE